MNDYTYIAIKDEFDLEIMSKVLVKLSIPYSIENGSTKDGYKFTIIVCKTLSKEELSAIKKIFNNMKKPVR